MDIGAIFPQTEAGGDRGAVRAIGQAVAELGYTHLAAYDHVLGGDTAVLGELGGPYTIDDPFREPLLMFAYLAGCTNLAFATSILIGPQRQTAGWPSRQRSWICCAAAASASGLASGGTNSSTTCSV